MDNRIKDAIRILRLSGYEVIEPKEKKSYNEFLSINVKCTELENVIKAFKVANNALYFDDSSDYKSALYEVCELLMPKDSPYEIGSEYLEE